MAVNKVVYNVDKYKK